MFKAILSGALPLTSLFGDDSMAQLVARAEKVSSPPGAPVAGAAVSEQAAVNQMLGRLYDDQLHPSLQRMALAFARAGAVLKRFDSDVLDDTLNGDPELLEAQLRDKIETEADVAAVGGSQQQQQQQDQQFMQPEAAGDTLNPWGSSAASLLRQIEEETESKLYLTVSCVKCVYAWYLVTIVLICSVPLWEIIFTFIMISCLCRLLGTVPENVRRLRDRMSKHFEESIDLDWTQREIDAHAKLVARHSPPAVGAEQEPNKLLRSLKLLAEMRLPYPPNLREESEFDEDLTDPEGLLNRVGVDLDPDAFENKAELHQVTNSTLRLHLKAHTLVPNFSCLTSSSFPPSCARNLPKAVASARCS